MRIINNYLNLEFFYYVCVDSKDHSLEIININI